MNDDGGDPHPQNSELPTLHAWMAERDSEMLANYTPGAYISINQHLPKEQSTSHNPPPGYNVIPNAWGAPKEGVGGSLVSSQRDYVQPGATYTANLAAQSVYGAPARPPPPRSAGPSYRRRLSNKSMTARSASSSRPQTPKTARPRPLFLATSMNAKLAEEKRSHGKQLESLKADMQRQKRDISLLRSQLHSRDSQIGELSTKLRSLATTPRKNGKGGGSSSSKQQQQQRQEQELGGGMEGRWRPGPLSSDDASNSIASGEGRGSVGAGEDSPSHRRLSALSQPARVREKSISDGIAKSHLDWVIHNAKQSPGPAEYRPDGAGFSPSGGKFNASRAKSELEWVMHRAKMSPGPGEYKIADTRRDSGAFSTAKPKTDLDWAIHRAGQTPGPGEYKPGNLDELKTGAFSTANPKSDLEWTIHRAKQLPGPGEYKIADKKHNSGAFSTANPKSDLDWVIHNASLTPGPMEYRPGGDAGSPVSGGKFNAGRSKSELEWVMHRASQVPGAGSYDLARADKLTQKSGHTGQFPFVYKPTTAAHAHLAKGVGAILAANRMKKIALAMLKPSSGFGGGGGGGDKNGVCGGGGGASKKMSEMNEEELVVFKKERAEAVEATKRHLAKLELKRTEREERLLRGEPLEEEEEAPTRVLFPKRKSSMGALLLNAKRSGELEKEVEKMETTTGGEGGSTATVNGVGGASTTEAAAAAETAAAGSGGGSGRNIELFPEIEVDKEKGSSTSVGMKKSVAAVDDSLVPPLEQKETPKATAAVADDGQVGTVNPPPSLLEDAIASDDSLIPIQEPVEPVAVALSTTPVEADADAGKDGSGNGGDGSVAVEPPEMP
eukprot:CAMPEP_0171746368 /NCGR_PEP_ID=MMETSP0991-20121206/38753_1 /TAXON_ID=483369 /ORGANISM="non described non described, Strain CCMP2098" /LENGTH=837 /DNA_ID=CAMNT_0012346095 /DNA_START=20 /DNA_END=2533 /DNA_ORIENTATION=+